MLFCNTKHSRNASKSLPQLVGLGPWPYFFCGRNTLGLLGVGDVVNRTVPCKVTGNVKFISVAAGWNHSVAVSEDGSLWSWGRNDTGQLGVKDINLARSPVNIPNTTGFRLIVAGYGSSLALDQNGDVWCFGKNDIGQIGMGNETRILIPTLKRIFKKHITTCCRK